MDIRKCHNGSTPPKRWAGLVREPEDVTRVMKLYDEQKDGFTDSVVFVGPMISSKDCAVLETVFPFVMRIPDPYSELKLPFCDNFPVNIPDKDNCNLMPRHNKNEPIAVVGMSCRLPGANSPIEFWNNLMTKKDCVGSVPNTRWTADHGCLDVSKLHRSIKAGFLSCSIDTFDSKFFSISPTELCYTDPQARILLQLTWEALENAGIQASSLRGTDTAIYLGIWKDEYKDLILTASSTWNGEKLRLYLGTSFGNAAARISQNLGTTGPALTTETGCSSSIYSVGHAMAALRDGKTNLAIAGGANLLLKPYVYSDYQGVLSTSGKSKFLQSDADGFARAEGVIVYILKRESDAIRDGDNIHALLRGFGASQEGLSLSVGTPTVDGERAAMSSALQDAGINPSVVDWVEMHGTGTIVGDPLEVDSTRLAYRISERDQGNMFITSVKANIGHTESVSGCASLLKVILAMKNGYIPAQHLTGPLKSNLNLDKMVVPTTNVEWSGNFAGVSSFGITGTNGHVIVERSQRTDTHEILNAYNQRPVYILPLSAKCPEAFSELKEEHITALEKLPDDMLGSYCYTASIGRNHFNGIRSVALGQTREEIINSLRTESTSMTRTGSKLCFLFPGHGCQSRDMGRELYEYCPIFRRHFDIVDNLLITNYGVNLKYWLFDNKEIPIYSQFSIFIMEYSLLKMWAHFGISPNTILGHSLGEVAAAISGGQISLPTALEILATRAGLLDHVNPGGMLAIRADEARTSTLISEFETETTTLYKNSSDWVDIAAINSSEQTIVSCPAESLSLFKNFVNQKGVNASILKGIDHPHHSRALDNGSVEFEKKASELLYSPGFPEINYISSVEGNILEPGQLLNANYWVKNMRDPVQFLRASTDTSLEGHLFLEIGPHPILSPLVMQNVELPGERICIPSMKKELPEWTSILQAIASLYKNGFDLNWTNVYRSIGQFTRIPERLPTYHFQNKERFWFTPDRDCSYPTYLECEEPIHPLLGRIISTPNDPPYSTLFCTTTAELLRRAGSWLADHKIGSHMIFPMAAFVEMAFAGIAELVPTARISGVQLTSFSIMFPLILEVEAEVQTLILKEGDGYTIKIYSRVRPGTKSMWNLHVTTAACPIQNSLTESGHESLQDTLELVEPYKEMATYGYNFGPSFQSLHNARRSANGNFCAELVLPTDGEKYWIHPTIIDAIIQASILSKPLTGLMLPTGFESFALQPFSGEKNIRIQADYGRSCLLVENLKNNFETRCILNSCQWTKTTLSAFGDGLSQKVLPIYFEQWEESTSQSTGLTEPKPTSTQVLFGSYQSGFVEQLQLSLQNNVIRLDPSSEMHMIGSLKATQYIYCFPDVNKIVNEENFRLNFRVILESILQLAKSIASGKLILVSHGIMSIKDEKAIFPQAGPVKGFVRTLANENEQINFVWLDLDTESTLSENVAQVFAELYTEQPFISYRGGVRFVGQLSPIETNIICPCPEGSFQLRLPQSCSVSDLDWEAVGATSHLELLHNEVAVHVHASGLNFKDLLNILKPTNEFASSSSIGADFSGEIVAIGSSVTLWSIGDSVLGMNIKQNPLPNNITIDENLVTRLPPAMTHTEAATLPTGFLTAYHCLVLVARLKPNDWVLIHTATGGVGLNAIQIAQKIGANIICTAGSVRKREYLKLLGITQVFNSRDLSFVEGVKNATCGVGVDVVLNSLTSEGWKEASLSVTRQGGTFVEISKLNIWSTHDVTKLRPDVSYTIEDLGIPLFERQRMLTLELGKWLANSDLRPIRHYVFEPEDIVTALGRLERATHVGKVVIRFGKELFNDRSTYLITGGCGGVGLLVAKFLLRNGAKHLLLVNRRLHSRNEVLHQLKEDQNIDVSGVLLRRTDISNTEQLSTLLTEIRHELPPLRGIFHCAGELSDATIANITQEKMDAVFSGKANGAWSLHYATRHLHLEHFVLFSSATCIVGAPGQGNYSAANAALHSLVEHRHRLGLNGVAIAWGLWEGIGMGTNLHDEIFGLKPFSAERGLRTLQYILQHTNALPTTLMASEFNVHASTGWLRQYVAPLLLGDRDNTRLHSSNLNEVKESGLSVKDTVEKTITSILKARSAIDSDSAFSALGMDSLMFIELKNKLRRNLGVTLEEIPRNMTINKLVDMVNEAKDKK